MGRRISGQDVDVMIGDLMVQIEQVSLDIEDNSKAVMSRGRPNGHIKGAVSASGEIVVDTANLNLILQSARSAGSFMDMPPFDMVFNAVTATDEFRVEVFEALIKISSLVDADSNGEDKLTHTLQFEVTGKDFVSINGVPYATPGDTENLI